MKYHLGLLLKSKCDSGFGHLKKHITYQKKTTSTLSSNILICGNKLGWCLKVIKSDISKKDLDFNHRRLLNYRSDITSLIPYNKCICDYTFQ